MLAARPAPGYIQLAETSVMTIKTMMLLLTLTLVPAAALAQSAADSADKPATQNASPALSGQGAQGGEQRRFTSDAGTAGLAAGSQESNPSLQSKIEQAIRSQAAMAASHVSVNVSYTEIALSGTVSSTQDKLTAERLAESFDGNRKLNDNLVVTGQGRSDLAPGQSAGNHSGTENTSPAANHSATNISNNNPTSN